jgi:hypothetical protein
LTIFPTPIQGKDGQAITREPHEICIDDHHDGDCDPHVVECEMGEMGWTQQMARHGSVADMLPPPALQEENGRETTILSSSLVFPRSPISQATAV